MGNCYSIDHIPEGHLHTNITCNIEEPLQKYRIRTVSNRLREGGLNRVLLDPNPRPELLQWLETFGPHEGFGSLVVLDVVFGYVLLFVLYMKNRK